MGAQAQSAGRGVLHLHGKEMVTLNIPTMLSNAEPQANAVLYPEGTEAGGCQLTEPLTADHLVLL